MQQDPAFATARLALLLARPGGPAAALATGPAQSPPAPRMGVLGDVRRLADRCGLGEARLVLWVDGAAAGGRAFDLGLTGRTQPVAVQPDRLHSYVRSPDPVTVLATVVAGTPTKVRVETFRNGLRDGHRPGSPAVMEVRNGRAFVRYWAAGTDVSQAVVSPIASLAAAADWTGSLAAFADRRHGQLMDVVARAESGGIAVAARSDALPGLVLHSRGAGHSYEILTVAELRDARADRTGALLSVTSSKDGVHRMSQLAVGGVVHGPSDGLPGVCLSRLQPDGSVQTERRLFREGVRIGGPAGAPASSCPKHGG